MGRARWREGLPWTVGAGTVRRRKGEAGAHDLRASVFLPLMCIDVKRCIKICTKLLPVATLGAWGLWEGSSLKNSLY